MDVYTQHYSIMTLCIVVSSWHRNTRIHLFGNVKKTKMSKTERVSMPIAQWNADTELGYLLP